MAGLMKEIFYYFLFLFCIQAYAQEDTTCYYGANNKPADSLNAVLMREVTHPAKRKLKITTYTKKGDHWEEFSQLVLKTRSENEFLVREYRDGRMESMYRRFYSATPGGLYEFKETWNDKVIRIGTSSTFIPLTLEGTEVRYYDSGQKRSESEYRNNQLLSNTNWLRNGDKYVDNVFYSVDEYPEYRAGTKMLHKYLSEYITQSGFNTDNLDGTVTIGFVITGAGAIDGVYVAGGIMPEFDELVADAVRTIPGEWKPAILDDKQVNCFLTIPISLRQEVPIGFENLELSFSNYTWMLYW
jgi:hypothetical protein